MWFSHVSRFQRWRSSDYVPLSATGHWKAIEIELGWSCDRPPVHMLVLCLFGKSLLILLFLYYKYWLSKYQNCTYCQNSCEEQAHCWATSFTPAVVVVTSTCLSACCSRSSSPLDKTKHQEMLRICWHMRQSPDLREDEQEEDSGDFLCSQSAPNASRCKRQLVPISCILRE